ncbi:MAG: sigma-70 family RNA polymerase sigma factor [Saprospiraceae bacterium]|nr:sigma-70 family RNA polymerase sigma factor [Saprospiraceae bacterium]
MKPVKSRELHFKELFQGHFDFLCRWLNSKTNCWDTSQELAQKTFVKIWENQICLEEIKDFRRFLVRTARNNLIDLVRSQKRFNEHSTAYNYLAEKETENHFSFERQDFFMRELMIAVKKLKPKTRQIFTLSKQDGLTYDEISEYLNIPKRTVEYNMKIALKSLRHQLQGIIER